MKFQLSMASAIKPVLLLLLLLSLAALCAAQSGDGSDDEDHIDTHTAYACQNGMLALGCPEGQVIRIRRANYGRFTLNLCNPQGVTTNMDLRCQSITSMNIVATECDGRNRCEFQVSNRLFGDPCPGTSKYAEVKYFCESADFVYVGGITTLKTLHQLPDAPYPPHRLNVPVPKRIQVCLLGHPSGGYVYDIHWTMPDSSQTILHFMLKYSVEGDVHEKEMQGNKLNDDGQYSYPFTPDKQSQFLDHKFAIKAFSLDNGWGDYSDYTVAQPCPGEWRPQLMTPAPTSIPKDGGGLRQMCYAMYELGVWWPETGPGKVRSVTCPWELGQGVMRFKCLSNGVWDPNGPETDDCIQITTARKPPTTTTTTTTTTTPTARLVPMNKVAVPSNPIITHIQHKMKQVGGRNATAVVGLLPSVVENMTSGIENAGNPKQKKAVADYYKDSILTIGDELLKDGNAWANMSVSQQRSAAATLLDSMETTGLLAASTMDIGASNTTHKANIVMKLLNIDLTMGQAAVLDDRSQMGSTSKVNQFSIPSGVLRQVMGMNHVSVPVVFVVLSNMSEWLTPESNIGSIHTNVIDARPRREPVRRMINTDIVSASISRNRVKNLAEPVVFLMEHRQVESVANPKCSFWDTDRGAWSSEGCLAFRSNRTHTICKCNHLTSFAVLMDITGATILIPATTRFSLELITYIGCTISIICLMLSWVTFACFKSLECDRNTIHKHLVFCLMVAQIVLVTGLQQTQPPVLCSIIAGVLHFFFLASFAWMCLEGVQLYVMLIEVFESERSRVLWYYLFGYGVPTLIVAISAGVFPRGYGTKFHCWLSVEKGFIWSFVGPALAVMLVNMVMLGIAISIMVRHSSMSHSMRQKTVPQKMSVSGSMYSVEVQDNHTYHRPEIPTWIKGAVVLVVLLGLTWVFGILFLDNVYHTLIFSYIFTILNTLQGLFIFVFHCLLNEKVQKEYRRLVRHSNWLPDCVRRYGGVSSSGSREPSSSGNMMARFLRGKKKNSGCGDSSSNSARPFLRKEQRYFSSSMPSSSDGATSSRLSSDTSNNNNRKSSRSSTFRSNGTTSHLLKPAEVNGITGELSEVLDCSVVDSEFVSEYCQQNLRVSAEVKRYSTASEDSGHGDRAGEEERDAEVDLDRLAALSVQSLSKHQPHLVSSSDFGDGDNKSDGWADSDNVDGDDVEEDPAEPSMFDNRAHWRAQENGYDDDEDDEGLVDGTDIRGSGRMLPEVQPLMLKQTDSERVLINNAVNKPREARQHNVPPRQSPSLTDMSFPNHKGEVSSPSHTSVPCLKFQPGQTRAPPSSAGEREKGAVMNSLPDLNHTRCNGVAKPPNRDVAGQVQSVKRHSSDGHTYFSPFRFSASEC